MASGTLIEPAGQETTSAETEAPTGGLDDERTETIGTFGYVLLMPLVIGLMVLITMYLA